MLLLLRCALLLSDVKCCRSNGMALCVCVADDATVQKFLGKENERDDFRVLLVEDDTMLVAAR